VETAKAQGREPEILTGAKRAKPGTRPDGAEGETAMGQEISKIQAALLILPLGFIDLRECLDHKSDRALKSLQQSF
jgi:hypothetical protein